MPLTKKPFWKGPGLCHSALGNTWSNVGYADKPVIQILQLYFPPTFSFTPYLESTVQCCSVHSQPTPVAICYVLRAYHPFVSTFINVTIFTVLMSCTLFPYHSFKMCPCLQSSRQALLSHIAIVIELPCATKGTGEWGKGTSAGRRWLREKSWAESFAGGLHFYFYQHLQLSKLTCCMMGIYWCLL